MPASTTVRQRRCSRPSGTPSCRPYEGIVTSKLHADTFRIHKDTKNQDAAFEVLRYFQETPALDLPVTMRRRCRPVPTCVDVAANLDKNYTRASPGDLPRRVGVPRQPEPRAGYAVVRRGDQRIKELEPLINGDPKSDLDAEAKKMESDLDGHLAHAG